MGRRRGPPCCCVVALLLRGASLHTLDPRVHQVAHELVVVILLGAMRPPHVLLARLTSIRHSTPVAACAFLAGLLTGVQPMAPSDVWRTTVLLALLRLAGLAIWATRLGDWPLAAGCWVWTNVPFTAGVLGGLAGRAPPPPLSPGCGSERTSPRHIEDAEAHLDAEVGGVPPAGAPTAVPTLRQDDSSAPLPLSPPTPPLSAPAACSAGALARAPEVRPPLARAPSPDAKSGRAGGGESLCEQHSWESDTTASAEGEAAAAGAGLVRAWSRRRVFWSASRRPSWCGRAGRARRRRLPSQLPSRRSYPRGSGTGLGTRRRDDAVKREEGTRRLLLETSTSP